MKQENDLMKAAVTMTACVVMGIGANSAQAVVIGQDDFDGNRNFVSFSQNPGAGVVTQRSDVFDIVSYTEALTSNQYEIATVQTNVFRPMRPTIDGKAFWISDLDGPTNPNTDKSGTLTWDFDVTGYENLQISFDLSDSFNHGTDDVLRIRTAFDGATLNNLAVSTAVVGDYTGIASDIGGTDSIVTNVNLLSLGGVVFSDTLARNVILPIAGVGDTLTLQFHVEGYGSSADHLIFDNIQLTGDLVPEPGSLALLGLSGVAMLVRRRNRRHA